MVEFIIVGLLIRHNVCLLLLLDFSYCLRGYCRLVTSRFYFVVRQLVCAGWVWFSVPFVGVLVTYD